ncbi:3-oxoacyl-[acyl-carrier-protein] reductase [Modestobacter italicus]|uniref:3-oxoacyl-[acyl-carrier-protein] reductase n=1 Tax=Modestobacter italicus (strain DSM 44449 / CECT 9708 / BC 501) TaxID=2732864 RepID=I4F039_MODI5|nr:SDR family oxidoreductase [Modestobacter marinus]CCH89002.1 3-oxoacyl-[acyl-carrier-protein] reductase [Modestobacter marinus]
MDLGLGGRGFLLTGASRGLGFATARALVDDGARVLLSARSADAVDAAAASLGGAPAATGLAADLSDARAAEELVGAAVDRLGRVDGALLSVGGPTPGGVLDVPEEAWRAGVDSVLLGPLRVLRALVPHLSDGAAIGLVLSTSVRQPIGSLAISNGLRPGLAMTAKALADELGPRGIRVFGLLPGTIATDRVTEVEAASGDPAAMRARTEAGIPLRRVGRPEEFGRVAAFALSPAASYLTGTMLTVDGGMTRAL